jgi:hypothetical protein
MPAIGQVITEEFSQDVTIAVTSILITLLLLLVMELMLNSEIIGLSETHGPQDGEKMDTSELKEMLELPNVELTVPHLMDLPVLDKLNQLKFADNAESYLIQSTQLELEF